MTTITFNTLTITINKR